jgi:hypothetical protein
MVNEEMTNDDLEARTLGNNIENQGEPIFIDPPKGKTRVLQYDEVLSDEEPLF